MPVICTGQSPDPESQSAPLKSWFWQPFHHQNQASGKGPVLILGFWGLRGDGLHQWASSGAQLAVCCSTDCNDAGYGE